MSGVKFTSVTSEQNRVNDTNTDQKVGKYNRNSSSIGKTSKRVWISHLHSHDKVAGTGDEAKLEPNSAGPL